MNGDGFKKWITVNPMEKQIAKMNTASKNITYIVDKNNFICQHDKLHTLTDRIGKWISEVMYRDIGKLVRMTHRNTSLQRVATIHKIRN